MHKVCIIDDEPDLLEMCADYFGDKFELKTFASATEAIAAFDQDYQPEVIVTDLKMPSLSGMGLAHHLNEKGTHPPIIMMSGHANKADVVEAIEERVQAFIEKPFDPRVLKSAVERVIEQNSIQPAGAAVLREFTTCALELLEQYRARFMKAENRLYEMEIQLCKSPEEVREFLASMREQTQLEARLETLQKTAKN